MIRSFYWENVCKYDFLLSIVSRDPVLKYMKGGMHNGEEQWIHERVAMMVKIQWKEEVSQSNGG